MCYNIVSPEETTLVKEANLSDIDERIQRLGTETRALLSKIKRRECSNSVGGARYAKWRTWFAEQNLDICSSCGRFYEKRVIHFHHTDPKTKKFIISSFMSQHSCVKKWRDIVMEEVRKCIPLCNSCHMELHHYMRKLEVTP